MTPTELIIKELNLIPVSEYANRDGDNYRAFDDGSAEIEVLEYLYALTRLIKPENALETGTYKGLSSTYIGLALKENGKGHLDTLEIEASHIVTAKEKWLKLGLQDWITEIHQDSLQFQPQKEYDFMFLDSEPYLRFKELDKYIVNLKQGGHVLIHDMPRNLCQGNVNPDHPDFKSWPVGEIPPEIRKRCFTNTMVMTHFNTPRGLVYFYKKHKEEFL